MKEQSKGITRLEMPKAQKFVNIADKEITKALEEGGAEEELEV